MNEYKAVTATGTSIITVSANSPADARAEIERQLSKPGRQAFLNLWTAHGKVIRIETMNENYYTKQIDRLDRGPDATHSLSISDGTGTMTNWMNVTEEQLDAIKEIMSRRDPEARTMKAPSPEERYIKTLDALTSAQNRIMHHAQRATTLHEYRNANHASNKLTKVIQLVQQARKSRRDG